MAQANATQAPKANAGNNAGNKAVARMYRNIPPALRPESTKAIRAQAAKTMAKAYAPVQAELDSQASRTQAIDSKRATDNAYYLNWLQGQSAQLDAHAQAADSAISAAQQGIADQASQGMVNLHNQMVAQGGAEPGHVTNPAQATAFNNTADAQHTADTIAAERSRSEAMRGTDAQHQRDLTASNFAYSASQEAKRTADTWNALKDIGDAKQKAVLSQAADSAKEVARLLDREITKAQAAATIKNQAQQVALDKQKLALDAKVAAGKQSTAQQNANAHTTSANAAAKNAQTAAQKAQDQANNPSASQVATQKENHTTTKTIWNAVAGIKPDWVTGHGDVAATHQFIKGQLVHEGVPPIYAQAAADLQMFGHLSGGTKAELHQAGYSGPLLHRK